MKDTTTIARVALPPAPPHRPPTIRGFEIEPSRKAAWKWALKSRQDWTLTDFLLEAGDGLLARIIAEHRASGRPVPPWIEKDLERRQKEE